MKAKQLTGNKVIIFDWDDTICPSTFVDQHKINCFSDLPLHYQNLMDRVGELAEKCLATAAKYGEVIIITNSDDGWVHFSAEKYVPNLVPIISKYRIVSARTSYEKFYPGQPLCWKAAAFAHEVNETFAANERDPLMLSSVNDPSFNSHDDSLVSTDVSSADDSQEEEEEKKSSPRLFRSKKGKRVACSISSKREVISFGDSMEERTAVKIVSGQLSALPKSVMFVSSPTPEQLIGQLSMLTGHMKYVCESPSSLDLEISPQQAEICAASILRKKSSSTRKYRGEDDGQKENNAFAANSGRNRSEEAYSI